MTTSTDSKTKTDRDPTSIYSKFMNKKLPENRSRKIGNSRMN